MKYKTKTNKIQTHNTNESTYSADLEFSRLESWSRDVSRPIFTSLGLGLGLEPRSLGLGFGLGT